METFQWYDYMRLASVVLLTISIWRIGRRAHARWDKYTDYLRDLVWVLCASLAALIENAVERIVRDSDLAFMTGFTFVVALFAFTALMKDEGFLKGDELNTRSTQL